jgi:hypothetical protein
MTVALILLTTAGFDHTVQKLLGREGSTDCCYGRHALPRNPFQGVSISDGWWIFQELEV